MKRHLIYCIALVTLMASCVKEPKIYLRLPAEDAAAIPYQKGQTIDFVNENGDTLAFTVTYDETQPFSEDNWSFYNYDAKMSITRQPWCYARTVILTHFTDTTDTRLMFTVIPEKYLYFRWNYELAIVDINLNGTTETVEVNGATYENVHIDSYTNPTGEYFHQWYYNEDIGLIALKNQKHSLTLLL